MFMLVSSVDCNASCLFPPGNGNCSNGLCVELNGTSVGDIATYSITSGYCIISTSRLTRECQKMECGMEGTYNTQR